MKRIIIISLTVLLTLGIAGYLGWRYFLARPNAPIDEAGPSEGIGITSPLPKALNDEPVFDYWINNKTNEIYYITENGEISAVTVTGEKRSTGSRATGFLSYIKPSADGSLLLIALGNPQSQAFAIYNTANKTWLGLPNGTTAAAWDPLLNDKLAYIKDNGQISRLNLFTVSSGKSQELLRIAQKDIELEWILPDIIYFKERPSVKYNSSVWSYDIKTRLIKTVVKEENGLMIKWGKAGDIGLKLSGGNLSLIDRNNRFLGTINLKTIPLECIFNSTLLYCAAPSNQQTAVAANLPDAYLKKGGSFKIDGLYSMNLTNLSQRSQSSIIPVFNSEVENFPLEIEHLEIKDGELIFINRVDNRIYKLFLTI